MGNTLDKTSSTKDSPYDVLKLENQLCFPLYACSKEVVRRYKPYLDPLGLTYTQYLTMMVMWEHETINSKKLGNLLYLDSGTLTPLLKKLEEKKFITRKRDPQDVRNLVVSVTEAGMELRDKALDIPAKLAACLDVSKEDLSSLYLILHKVLAGIR